MKQRPVLPEALAAQGRPGPHQPGISRCHHPERPGPDSWRAFIKYSFEYLIKIRPSATTCCTSPARATARRWTAAHPGTFVLGLGDAAELARRHAAWAFGAGSA